MKKKTLMYMAVVVSAMAIMAHAATIDNTVGGSGYPGNLDGQCYVIGAKTLDLSVTTVASNDVVQMITVPDGAIVLSVQYNVESAATNAVTFDIGDGSVATGYVSNAVVTNIGAWASSGISATSSGKFYADSDTIDLHFDNAPGTEGTIDVTAVLFRGTRE